MQAIKFCSSLIFHHHRIHVQYTCIYIHVYIYMYIAHVFYNDEILMMNKI